MATPTALPSGVYGAYKRATRFFLDWLLRAQAHGTTHATSLASPTLDAFHAVVDAIARAPATQLSPTLLHSLPRALAACQTAITLRERVTQYFVSAGAADDAHAHFLTRLKTWRAILQRVEQSGTDPASQRHNGKKPMDAGRDGKHGNDVGDSVRFTNYYDVLRLPDDYFADDLDVVMDSEASTVPVLATRGVSDADRKKLFDEAFQEDLEMELVCFLMELEEMSEHVYQTYVDVKHEKRTLVEATAVVYAAILLTQSRVAALQLRYPSIKQADDVLILLQDRVTKPLAYKMADTLARAIHERNAAHIPGFFLGEYQWVISSLKTFTSAIPTDPTQTLILRERHFGDNYDEEFTPHYLLPNLSMISPFFMQQLPMLYNVMLGRQQRGTTLKDDSLPDGFFKLLDEFFLTKTVSIPLVFACNCWVKSVAALQGAGTLKRLASVTTAHTREIERRLFASVEKGHVLQADREVHAVMKSMASELNLRRIAVSQGHVGRRHLQANPILAGYTMLYDQIRFLHIGGESMLVTSRLRAFLHLYSALVDRQLLARIPFFEDLLGVYGTVMFTPSRVAAVHGSYCRTYLLSSHMTAAGVDALFRGAPQPSRQTAIRVRECYHLADLSSTYRLVINQDLSALASHHASLAVKDQLVRVADQCADEVLTSRVLSRDMLKLNDDMADLFESLCDGLGRRWYHDEYLTSREPGVSRQYMVNRALEDAVMVPLMPFLDCLNADGTTDASRLVRMDSVRLSRVDDNNIAQYCQRAATIIARRFNPANAATIETSYFTLRPYRDVLSREFGSLDFKTKIQNRSRENHFCELMNLLEDTPGALTESELRTVKKRIKNDPEILLMVSVTSELATVLHLAAAGPGHDVALVEWLIQMGALYWQPAGHFRSGRSNALGGGINQLAVHSAAAAGHMDSVLLLLEADNMRDLNTPTYHTSECLVHLAVKNGHRNVYKLLVTLGADVRGRTRAGKRVSDLTNDVQWKREILGTIAQQERMHGETPQGNREGLFRHMQDQHADRLRRSVATQRDQERTETAAGTQSNTSVHGLPPAAAASSSEGRSSKKKGKKGKKDKKKTPAQPARSATIAVEPAHAGSTPSQSGDDFVAQPPQIDANNGLTSLLQDLHMGASSGSPGLVAEMDSSVEEFKQSKATLMDAFSKLSGVSAASTTEQEQAASRAYAVLDQLQQIIGFMRRPDQLNAMPRELRLVFASSAYDAIHLMNKFDRPAHTRAVVDPAPPGATNVEKLREMCLMQNYFIGFIAGAAQIFASLGRRTQARELLDVGEKRLLKLEERPTSKFDGWAQHYSQTRAACGLGKASGDDARRQLFP